ncbi:hypothetical protein CLV32_2267 [Pedobacter duraquae]|uniref:Uncharacterized protein n=1 Tax=Pedobacter duraquae TaxID=425511 RepID=A0A4V3C3T0_9SPHI|nr:hypothetical protein CLV32_2267 [Pedobacter duraquae]
MSCIFIDKYFKDSEFNPLFVFKSIEMATVQACQLLAMLVFIPGLPVLIYTVANACRYGFLESYTSQSGTEFHLPDPQYVSCLWFNVLDYP